MFDIALHQLRHGVAIATGRSVRATDVTALASQMRVSIDEFGPPDAEATAEMLGTPPPDVRQKMAELGWRRAVKTAFKHTDYYRQLGLDKGLRPQDIPLGQRRLIPTVRKTDVAESSQAFADRRRSACVVSSTSGTTGSPCEMLFTPHEFAVASGYTAIALMAHNGLGRQDHVAISLTSRATATLQTITAGLQLAEIPFSSIGVVDPQLALERLARSESRPVTALLSCPSYLALLCRVARELEYTAEDFHLTQIFCGGEVLSTRVEQLTCETFGARVVESYASTEAFPISGEICEQHHLHFPGHTGLVEVLDDRTEDDAEPGRPGVLTFTPFPTYREGMHFLRYSSGDYVRVVDQDSLDCTMRGLFATSLPLGRKVAEFRGVSVFHRDVLDLLDAVAPLAAPHTYGIAIVEGGLMLHAVGADSLSDRLSREANRRGLPITRFGMHERADSIPQRFINRSESMEDTAAAIRARQHRSQTNSTSEAAIWRR